MKSFKSGFVNIIGNPNVGKSTLLNQLVRGKLAIVSPKVQTTRHRIKGIVNGENHQIIISDTPGILEPKYALQEKMMNAVFESFKDADIITLVIEVGENESLDHPKILDRLKMIEQPVVLLMNKIDLVSQEKLEEQTQFWHEKLPNAEILPISALNGFNLDFLITKLIELLPESPPYFPTDQWTDKSERFIVEETVREKILLNYQKEIPYAVEVVVNQFKEEKDIIRIDANIFVERDSQKGIIIGHKGLALQKVGKSARLDLEDFFKKKIVLKLFVKVNKDWRKKDSILKNFGY